jgi:hypothetical protein
MLDARLSNPALLSAIGRPAIGRLERSIADAVLAGSAAAAAGSRMD